MLGYCFHYCIHSIFQTNAIMRISTGNQQWVVERMGSLNVVRVGIFQKCSQDQCSVLVILVRDPALSECRRWSSGMITRLLSICILIWTTNAHFVYIHVLSSTNISPGNYMQNPITRSSYWKNKRSQRCI